MNKNEYNISIYIQMKNTPFFCTQVVTRWTIGIDTNLYDVGHFTKYKEVIEKLVVDMAQFIINFVSKKILDIIENESIIN